MNTCGTEPDCAKPDTDQPQQQTHKPKARAHAKDGLRAEVPGSLVLRSKRGHFARRPEPRVLRSSIHIHLP
jgi:hypothetical protein